MRCTPEPPVGRMPLPNCRNTIMKMCDNSWVAPWHAGCLVPVVFGSYMAPDAAAVVLVPPGTASLKCVP